VKRLFFPALFVAGFAVAGTFSGVVIADVTTTGTVPTVPAATTAPVTTAAATTTAPPITTTKTKTKPKAKTSASPTTLPAGVRVGGVRVGGLTPSEAVSAVEQAFERPLRVAVDRRTFTLRPTDYASAYAATAVARARVSSAGTNAHLVVAVRGSLVRTWATGIAHRFARAPADARLTFSADKPRVTKERVGRSVNARRLSAKVIAALQTNSRLPVRVHSRAVLPTVSTASFGSVIVINRSLNRLTLYSGAKYVRTFPVATGQAIYPTPAGTFHIVVKWKNPWWYPPTQDSWAKGLQPVPPGPDNPLGTRWMGLSVPGVGIHGTDEPTSIGYSASHGCIRMQVPDAEWLFDHVDIGTTVHIV
jgi:lipoprotein-anchoring transpeptidase ErfK/SrfK